MNKFLVYVYYTFFSYIIKYKTAFSGPKKSLSAYAGRLCFLIRKIDVLIHL